MTTARPSSVTAYLDQLPSERRLALQAVREVVLAHLNPGFEEGIQYGMIGYYVPHSLFPSGYHSDSKEPLPFASLGAQKNHLALYLMCILSESEQEQFRAAWAKSGKKLDMGKSCVRFQKPDDLALDVIGATISAVTVEAYVQHYQAARSAGSPAKAVRASAAPKSGKANGNRR